MIDKLAKLAVGLLIFNATTLAAWAQMPNVDPEKTRQILDIGTVQGYGPIFFGMIITLVIVYALQTMGWAPIPKTKSQADFQDKFNKVQGENTELKAKFAALEARMDEREKAEKALADQIAAFERLGRG